MEEKKDRKTRQAERKAFLKSKRQNKSTTDRILGASVAKKSTSIMQLRDHTGGRARKTRRG